MNNVGFKFIQIGVLQHNQEYFCKMKSNQSSVDTRIKGLMERMAHSAGTKPEELTKLQRTVIFTHAVNQEFGLECVDRNGEVIEFPENWSKANEGVYRFNYRLNSKEGNSKEKDSKIVQFRFVDNQQEDGNISVNYSLEDSEELNQYELKYDTAKSEQCYKAYRKHLEQKLKPKKADKPQVEGQRILEPQWRTPNFQNPRQPFPIVVPNQNPNNPFRNPYTGGEYIGPDNEIFRGRGQNNPFGPIDTQPDFNDPRRPIGSRFDPVDPFGGHGIDEKPRGGKGGDFMGFNQFGQPYGGGKGGFNPGKFL